MAEGKQFNFKRFSVKNGSSGLKVGTDGVLLGASARIPESPSFTVLDIGTGTGLIALMLAQRLSDTGADFAITGIDISEEAVLTAAENFAASPWASRLHASHCALADYCPPGLVDLIVSNPPYFENSLRNPDLLQATARHTDTLSYREILAFAAENLSPEGSLSVILPSEEENAMVRYAASFGLYPSRIITVQTTAKKAPKRIVADFGRAKTQTVRQNLILQDGNCRTAQYNALTSGFYLD